MTLVHHDARTAEISVFTFKDGLFSAVAHDLHIGVRRFTIDADDAMVTAVIDARSLEVVSAMKSGVPAHDAITAIAKKEIEKSIVSDVLAARKYPEIIFRSTSITDGEVIGQLTLCGVTRSVRGPRTSGGRTVEMRLDQRDFGIKPYSAMLGTLKLKPEVIVRATLPAT